MKNELKNCDCNKVAFMAVVRYIDVGEQIKGALFLGDQYICDTLETKWNGWEISRSYHLKKKKLRRVSLGGGFYRNGETRLYLVDYNNQSHGIIDDSALSPRPGNITVGFRNGGSKQPFANQMMMLSDQMRNFLTRTLSDLDYVFVDVIYATALQIASLRQRALWGKGFQLNKSQKEELAHLQSFYLDTDHLPTLFDLIEKSNLI